MMMQMAREADASATVAVLGPRGLRTVQRELVLSTRGSQSSTGQPLAYSLRSVQGNAAIIGGDTSTPRVQFSGGPGPYSFELTVTDTNGNTATDFLTVFYAGT